MEKNKDVNRLIEALKDKKWADRGLAAGALGKIGDARAVEPLKQALKDKNGVVQLNAVMALEQLKAKKK